MNYNKIFIIGFNKTGTRSLHNFFQKNQIKSIHWDRGRIARRIKNNYNNNIPLLNEYNEYIVFSDMEDYKKLNYAHIDYYQELYRQYPNSKFILNIRDVENWIKSRNNHLNGFYTKELCSLYKLNKNELNDLWRKIYFKHMNDVLNFFENKPSSLLIFNIEKDNIQKVIEFLPEYILDKKYYIHIGKT